MRKLLLMFGFLSVLSGVLALVIPKYRLVSADSEAWDFGTVRSNQRLEHTFTITNYSKGEARFDKIITACGCTKVQLAQLHLDAGHSTTARCYVEVGGRRNALSTGFHIFYHISNSTTILSIPFSLHAAIKNDVIVTPPEVVLSDAPNTVQTLAVSGGNARVLSAVANSNSIAATLVGNRVELRYVRSKWSIPGDRFVLRLITTSPTEKTILIPIRVQSGKQF